MHQQYSFSVTGYTGHEEKILAMRNRNRQLKCTREYLDWRYLGQKHAEAPAVFWLQDSNGNPVAMAALIFRPYYVDGKPATFAVLGDISVNEECRGTGVGAKLVEHINDYLDTCRPACGVVIPNRAAERRVREANWRTVSHLVPFVYILAPGTKFGGLARLPFLVKFGATALRRLTRLRIRAQKKHGISASVCTGFDGEFQQFWDDFPKTTLIARDRGLAALQWRYHPVSGCIYTVTKFYRGNALVGYAVHDLSGEGMCLLSEFIVYDLALVQPCMAAFLELVMEDERIVTVRVALIEGSDHARELRKFGFFERSPKTALQIYRPFHSRLNDGKNWFVTAGDKDA